MSVLHPHIHLPKIGMRIVKSVAAMMLCFAVYYARGKQGIPFYSLIAALQCIQPYSTSTRKFARNRLIGTAIGAVWGTLIMLVMHYLRPQPLIQHRLLYYLIICLMTGLVIYTTVVLGVKDTAYFTSVVFLCIVINHAWDESPWGFVFNRVTDTCIGILMAFLVNDIHLPRTKHWNTLYITGIDNALTTGEDPISDYSRIEWNRMVEEGAHITVATRQTPASIRENLAGVKLNHPVIVMDGAALYDMKEKRYLACTYMTEEEAQLASHFLDAEGLHYFTNKIIDDLLIIYYGDNANSVEQDVIRTRRTSPYRNYVHRTRQVYDHVVYLFLILPDDKCRTVYEKMLKHPWTQNLRIVMEPMYGYEGYTFLKIYSPKVSREEMIEELKQRTGIQDVLVFGGGTRPSDVLIRQPDTDALVRQLKKYYEPITIAPFS